jgi:hypothetical protein
MKEYKLYTISNNVKCNIPLDTNILVSLSSMSISGEFVGKIQKDGRCFQGVYSYNIEFIIYAMDKVFHDSCFSNTTDNVYIARDSQGLILSLDAVENCREFLPVDVPLIVNWFMSDKFKEEVFGL